MGVMMDRKTHAVVKCIFLSVLLFAFLMTPTLLVADIFLGNVTGTLAITTPDGQVLTVEAGEPLPPIPSGSSIELITGTAEVSATDTDIVYVLVERSTVTVEGGTKSFIWVDLRTGDTCLEVIGGRVSVLQTNGLTETVDEQEVYCRATLKRDTLLEPAEATGRQNDASEGLVSGY